MNTIQHTCCKPGICSNTNGTQFSYGTDTITSRGGVMISAGVSRLKKMKRALTDRGFGQYVVLLGLALLAWAML